MHSLLQSRIDRKLSETWFYLNLSTGAKRISNTIYHLSSPLPPPPPRQLIVRRVMKEYEINVQDIQLNYWHSHSLQTGLIPEVPDPHRCCKKVSLSRPPLLPLQWISHWCKECPLRKPVNWISAHNYGKPKCIYTKPTFSWIRIFCLFNSTSSDIMCSRIRPLDQNCWSWYHFSQEKIPHPLIPVAIYLN